MMSLFARSHPWRRRILLTVVVLSETVLLLALAEGGLRAWGYGHSTQPFIKKHCDGADWYVLNSRYYDQFINLEGPLPRYDYPGSTVVRGTKAPGTYRVFVFGSSAAYGWFFPDYSMGCMLETMLRSSCPGCRFEVITVGFNGMNSFTMRYMAEECAKLQPDLFLVYMGNNEIIGPFGLQTVVGSRHKSAAVMQAIVRANLWLSDLRLFQLFGVPSQKIFSKSVAHLKWGGDVGVRDAGDPRFQRVYDTFRQNLDSICGSARRAGAQTALCTVGRNLKDAPPASSEHRKTLTPAEEAEWDLFGYELGKSLERMHNYSAAAGAYERAAAIDDTHADLMYRLGHCYLALEDHGRARECFHKAAENDLGCLSANTTINRIIGEAARSNSGAGVRLIDTARALEADSPDGITGCEQFHDHIHFTFRGNYAVAREMFGTVMALVQQKGDCGSASPEPPSMEQCMQLMGYSPGVQLREVKTVLSMFDKQIGNPVVPHLQSLQALLERQVGANPDEAIAEGYRQALELDGGNLRIRFGLVECRNTLGRGSDALDDLRFLVANAPCTWQYRNGLAWALIGRDPAEARRQGDELLELYPEYKDTHVTAANVALRSGDTDEAVRRFRKVVAMDGQNAHLQRMLGSCLALKGDFREAASWMRKAVGLDAAQDEAVTTDLRIALSEFRSAGNWNKVAEGCRTALQLKPDSGEFRTQLAEALCELKQFEDAWTEVAECQKRSISIPNGLMDRLKRDSGRER